MPQDLDPLETREWLDALDSVVTFDGTDRATFLLDELLSDARRSGVPVPYSANTPYLNTIPPDREAPHPGDLEIEHKIRSLIRWNAVATVLRANKESAPSWAATSRASSPAATPLRHRLQPLLARTQRVARRRPGLHPGSLLAGHLRPRHSSRAGSPRTSCSNSARRSTAAACRRIRTRG